MLDFVGKWCKLWHLFINQSKSNLIHFRNECNQRSIFHFKVGDDEISYTTIHKCLGIYFHENLNLEYTVEILSKSGGRALGALPSKVHGNQSIGYRTYTKLCNSRVVPVIDY